MFLFYTEKSGKTLHLLKAGSKKIGGTKKRKKVGLLGTFAQYKDSKSASKPGQQQIQQPSQIFGGPPQLQIPGHELSLIHI